MLRALAESAVSPVVYTFSATNLRMADCLALNVLGWVTCPLWSQLPHLYTETALPTCILGAAE